MFSQKGTFLNSMFVSLRMWALFAHFKDRNQNDHLSPPPLKASAWFSLPSIWLHLSKRRKTINLEYSIGSEKYIFKFQSSALKKKKKRTVLYIGCFPSYLESWEPRSIKIGCAGKAPRHVSFTVGLPGGSGALGLRMLLAGFSLSLLCAHPDGDMPLGPALRKLSWRKSSPDTHTRVLLLGQGPRQPCLPPSRFFSPA